jgi:hypothetical protein
MIEIFYNLPALERNEDEGFAPIFYVYPTM